MGEGDLLVVESDDDVENSQPGELRLSPETIVRIGGMPASRDELRPGMSVPVEFGKDGEIVHAIEIEVEGDSKQFIHGELFSIDAQNNKLTLLIDDETDIPKQREFQLDQAVAVVVDGAKAPLQELRKGSKLKLRLASDKPVVRSIRVESASEIRDANKAESP